MFICPFSICSTYVLHTSVGIKIVASDIGRALAGTPLLVVQPEDDVEDVKDDVQSDLSKVRMSHEWKRLRTIGYRVDGVSPQSHYRAIARKVYAR